MASCEFKSKNVLEMPSERATMIVSDPEGDTKILESYLSIYEKLSEHFKATNKEMQLQPQPDRLFIGDCQDFGYNIDLILAGDNLATVQCVEKYDHGVLEQGLNNYHQGSRNVPEYTALGGNRDYMLARILGRNIETCQLPWPPKEYRSTMPNYERQDEMSKEMALAVTQTRSLCVDKYFGSEDYPLWSCANLFFTEILGRLADGWTVGRLDNKNTFFLRVQFFKLIVLALDTMGSGNGLVQSIYSKCNKESRAYLTGKYNEFKTAYETKFKPYFERSLLSEKELEKELEEKRKKEREKKPEDEPEKRVLSKDETYKHFKPYFRPFINNDQEDNENEHFKEFEDHLTQFRETARTNIQESNLVHVYDRVKYRIIAVHTGISKLYGSNTEKECDILYDVPFGVENGVIQWKNIKSLCEDWAGKYGEDVIKVWSDKLNAIVRIVAEMATNEKPDNEKVESDKMQLSEFFGPLAFRLLTTLFNSNQKCWALLVLLAGPDLKNPGEVVSLPGRENKLGGYSKYDPRNDVAFFFGKPVNPEKIEEYNVPIGVEESIEKSTTSYKIQWKDIQLWCEAWTVKHDRRMSPRKLWEVIFNDFVRIFAEWAEKEPDIGKVEEQILELRSKYFSGNSMALQLHTLFNTKDICCRLLYLMAQAQLVEPAVKAVGLQFNYGPATGENLKMVPCNQENLAGKSTYVALGHIPTAFGVGSMQKFPVEGLFSAVGRSDTQYTRPCCAAQIVFPGCKGYIQVMERGILEVLKKVFPENRTEEVLKEVHKFAESLEEISKILFPEGVETMWRRGPSFPGNAADKHKGPYSLWSTRKSTDNKSTKFVFKYDNEIEANLEPCNGCPFTAFVFGNLTLYSQKLGDNGFFYLTSSKEKPPLNINYVSWINKASDLRIVSCV
tara:strand:- start:208 stop:2904 length:2697 start_codon:yes stop_codon:yes gene_type:complete